MGTARVEAAVNGPAVGAGVNLALAATPRRTVSGPDAWDRAVEIERVRQMWSLPRRRKES
ncbi:hypothetical protein ACFLIM_05665 [Nonomuraea sp. M3C6]|uniref:Uncharacterized protein n=1 Tax=Nonomuraea marmarensis TaxID=3351344 RepID=A0ABW7A5P9_9ACTN